MDYDVQHDSHTHACLTLEHESRFVLSVQPFNCHINQFREEACLLVILLIPFSCTPDYNYGFFDLGISVIFQ